MNLKPGVRVLGIRPEMILALIAANDVYQEFKAELTITAVTEGSHSVGSAHYNGCGLDIRTFVLPSEVRPKATAKIKAALGDDYDVVLEGDHIHIEFQPKKPY